MRLGYCRSTGFQIGARDSLDDLAQSDDLPIRHEHAF
jgi:hypothetical protein